MTMKEVWELGQSLREKRYEEAKFGPTLEEVRDNPERSIGDVLPGHMFYDGFQREGSDEALKEVRGFETPSEDEVSDEVMKMYLELQSEFLSWYDRKWDILEEVLEEEEEER